MDSIFPRFHTTRSKRFIFARQAFAIAFADRFAYLADPNFVDVPIEALLSDAYLDARCEEMQQDRIGNIKAGTKEQLGVAHALAGSMPDYSSGGSTTHLSVIDKDGVAVSLTQTLLSLWGSRVTIPGPGSAHEQRHDVVRSGTGSPELDRGRQEAGREYVPGHRDAQRRSRGRTRRQWRPPYHELRCPNCHESDRSRFLDAGSRTSPRIDRSTAALYVSSRMPKSTVDGLSALGHRVSLRDETLFFGDFASPACVQRTDAGELRGGVDPFYYPATAQGI